MPVIKIEMDQISKEKKKQLIENITREAAIVTGYPPEFFYVYVHEYPSENIGVGGKTIAEIKNSKLNLS